MKTITPSITSRAWIMRMPITVTTPLMALRTTIPERLDNHLGNINKATMRLPTAWLRLLATFLRRDGELACPVR
jgi:hypothetical protein